LPDKSRFPVFFSLYQKAGKNTAAMVKALFEKK